MKNWHKQALLGAVIIIAPFIALKLLGRDFSYQRELVVKTYRQKADCLPVSMTTLLDDERIILHPTIQFAFVKNGILKTIGTTDLVFKDNPEGYYTSTTHQTIDACLNFRSTNQRNKLLNSVHDLPKPYRLQCKVLIAVQKPGREVKHHYGSVFICADKLKLIN